MLADRYDRSGLTVDDGGVAAAGVLGAVLRHGADFFALGDLIEQFGQHGTVAVAPRGELHRPDVRSGRVHGQMDLAPLASALNAVLAGLPFAITEKLDTGAVDEQVHGAIGMAKRDMDGQRLLSSAQSGVVGHRPV